MFLIGFFFVLFYVGVFLFFIKETRTVLDYSRSLQETSSTEPVTLIMPIYGAQPSSETLFTSWLNQDYKGKIQFIFALQDARDPALVILEKLKHKYSFETVIHPVLNGYTGKVSNLLHACKIAHHETLILADSDTRATPQTVSKIIAQLAHSEIVVCVAYHGEAPDLWSKIFAYTWNTITTHWVPAAIYKKRVPAIAGLGLSMKKITLQKMGGWESIGTYVSSDAAISKLAKQNNIHVSVGPTIYSSVEPFTFRKLFLKLQRGSHAALRMSPLGMLPTLCIYSFVYAYVLLLPAAFVFHSLYFFLFYLIVLGIRLFQAADMEYRIKKKWRLPYEVFFADIVCPFILWTSLFWPYVTWGGISYRVDFDGKLTPRSTDMFT